MMIWQGAESCGAVRYPKGSCSVEDVSKVPAPFSQSTAYSTLTGVPAKPGVTGVLDIDDIGVASMIRMVSSVYERTTCQYRVSEAQTEVLTKKRNPKVMDSRFICR